MGNKAILMSIQPQWLAKIINGEKTIEVRKKFPKDYVGWVYIYCTKDKKLLMAQRGNFKGFELINTKDYGDYVYTNICECLNGKVVARFWCNEVEEIYNNHRYTYFCKCGNGWINTSTLCMKTQLEEEELDKYFQGKKGYAIHISKLEVFDKPKELKEFRHTCKAEYRGYNRWQPCSKECMHCVCRQLDDEGYSQCFSRLQKAPQSWCYVEDTQ
jgi:predicted transcriptional regulator